ncbi:MAG: hypothetical protein MUQ56_09135 [Thermoleophilia bacterium]|nr:hypothetical protein [Thermoleophilia bacterium]
MSAIGIAIGKQVLLEEQHFFVEEELDNSEHVPRIARVAGSVQRALELEGGDRAEAARAKRELIDFGRALFVEEWMKPLADDDKAPSEAEAIAEFKRCLRDATK